MKTILSISLALAAVLTLGFLADPAHAFQLAADPHATDAFLVGLHLPHFGDAGGLGIGIAFFGLSTNKLVLRSVDEFMADYKPVYQPLYPLFLGKSQQYSEEVGVLNFNRLEAVGDIRAKHITPKDTDIRQIAVIEGKKTFKKYFLANQFVQSSLQDQSRTEDVVSQVLDEHQKQADDLLLKGDGTSNSDVANNGLFWSGDSNFIANSSYEVTGTDKLLALHAKIIEQAQIANAVSGRKVIVFYGANVLPYVGGLFAASNAPFKRVLQESLGGDYSIVEMPSATTPATSHGFAIYNLEQIKLHYVTLPKLKDQGVNSEKMYSWHNFLIGSMMAEILARYAAIKQPLTFA